MSKETINQILTRVANEYTPQEIDDYRNNLIIEEKLGRDKRYYEKIEQQQQAEKKHE